MIISHAGLEALKQREALRHRAYPDPATGGEPWTIGYGRAHGVHDGDVITEAQAEVFLLEDLGEVYDCIGGNVHAPLAQHQFDALCSLIFNIGTGAFAKSTLRRLLNAGDYLAAADQFPRWNKAAGRVMKGLVNRRARERAQFLGKDQP